MQSEQFTVKNIKCNGCVNNVKGKIGALPGVTGVEVTIEGGQVVVTGEGLDRAALSAKLREIGYPEA